MTRKKDKVLRKSGQRAEKPVQETRSQDISYRFELVPYNLANNIHADASAFLINKKYKEIFGEGRNRDQDGLPWKCGVLKLSYGPRTIYRLFAGGQHLKLDQHKVGLTQLSINALNFNHPENAGNGYFLKVRKAPPVVGRFLLYWQHPDNAVRVAFKAAIWLTIVSIVGGWLFATMMTSIIRNG
ncbi:MAG: hypothetical protein U1F40_07985 [Turneriella sp.]